MIKDCFALGFPWQTADPFLFCVHHLDYYPAGNADLGPQGSLAGRDLGMDFTPQDGWRMYHGQKVPGFPGHPHRGFETITAVRRGWVDHADSMGAAGRYGSGDVQWMTAGRGVQHSEMFPLLNPEGDNTLELFQIWLNLPRQNKMVAPHFKMLWHPDIPKLQLKDKQGRSIELELIAGQYGESQPPAPPPDSWAGIAEHNVAVWLLKLAPEAEWTLPAAQEPLNRNLYFYRGHSLQVAGEAVEEHWGLSLDTQASVIKNGPETSELLLLQGRPIRELVVQYGPFVMNNKAEIMQAFDDYEKTRFGGWPWPQAEVVHEQRSRFALHADGHEEQPSKSETAASS